MQNSAWKLTALAGVIGLGFLIVLQAQKNMGDGQEPGSESEPTASVTHPAGEDGKQPAEGSDEKKLLALNGEPELDETDSRESLTADSAPVPDFADRPVLAENLARLSSFAPADTDFAETGGTGIRTVSAETPSAEGNSTSGNSFDTLPADLNTQPTPDFGESTDTRSELVTESNGQPPRLIFDESTVPEAGAVEPAPGATEDPFATGSVTAETLPDAQQESEAASKKRALELVATARRSIDAGDLDTARELAQAALEMPVTYTPLDDRPETVLREIDQLLKFRNLPAESESVVAKSTSEPPLLLLTGGQAEEKPFGDQPFETFPEKEPSSDPPLLTGNDNTLFPGEAPSLEPVTAVPEGDFQPFGPQARDAATTGASVNETENPFGESSSEPAALTTTTTAVQTQASGEVITGVTGDATIPENGPKPALKPELTIEKTAPAEAFLDKPMVYSVNVTNRGNATAAELVVEDHIPKGCRLIGTRPQAVMIGTKLIWRLGRLEAGKSQSILVKVIPIEQGEIGSVATVSFVTEVAARTEIRSSSYTPLELTVEAPRKVNSGEVVVMKFRVKNNSGQNALNVKLQDIIPDGLLHETGNDLTYDIGTIESGRTFTADLELKAVKSGRFTNQATITADGGLRSEAVSEIEILGAAGVSLQAVPGKSVLVGQKTVHATRVTNPSQTTAEGFTVTSRLPEEVRFLSATENGRYEASSHSVRWQIPGLAPGQSLVLQTSLLPKLHGTFGTLTQLNQPGQPISKVESQLSVRGIAAMAIELKNVPVTVVANDEFSVDATIFNRGTGPDSNVQLSLILPDGIEFVSARGPVRIERQPIALTSSGQKPMVTSVEIPEIGEKASVDFQITLRSTTAGRPKIRAEVSSTQLTDPVATEAAIVVINEAP